MPEMAMAKKAELNVRLQPRDYELFELLERYRWLTIDQLKLEFQWDKESLYKRLRKLRQAGYLFMWQKTSYDPAYVALDNQGAIALQKARGISVDKVYWRWQNANFDKTQIPHANLTARVMLKLRQASRQHPHFRLMEQPDVVNYLPARRQSAQHPFSLKAKYLYEGRSWEKGCNPDQVFGLVDRQNTATWTFLESDRGNHPEKRGSFGEHRQIFPKLVTYFQIFRQKLVQSELKLTNFRVLWVVETKDEKGTLKRIRNMREVATEATNGQVPDLFLFASAYELLPGASAIDFGFQNAAGETRPLRV